MPGHWPRRRRRLAVRVSGHSGWPNWVLPLFATPKRGRTPSGPPRCQLASRHTFPSTDPPSRGRLRSSTALLLRRLAVLVEPADDVQDLRHMMTRPRLDAVRLVRHAHQHTLHAQDLERLVVLLRVRHRRAVVRL